ncbi:Cytochrome c-type biogenesis protein CcdA (DsbD analog) [hydrothermal vent metagenome]|uniref:Cytochrome c-type biogenesis protein CcdA (DsbD analog) n=1 Tax=hydrothermal vent metagenome TaxID=652676 RepID=A0A3B0XPT2_9ZZZZ
MITLLLISATLLGLLAFFEPCTIATHTLFSVKVNQERNQKNCCQSLLAVWLSRSILLAILFSAVTFFTIAPTWSNTLPSIILSVMAIIYLLSRFVYIPVPHLAFYKLLPASKRLPYSIQLGLTLPACTLPLIVIVAGMSATLDSVAIAAISGLLFATFFTAPMVIASFNGLNKKALELLNRTANGSPYFTAVLLFSLALFLLIPSLEINIDEFKQVLTEASWAGIGLSFLAGFVFSFNPVSFASIPVILAYVTKAHEERRAVLMGSAFVGGMIVTHVALGVTAALGGEWVQSIMGRHWGLVLGPVLIVMGLMWSGWLNIRLPWIGMKAKRVTGIWGAFLLGIPFTVAVCPFCTPALLVTLTASAAIGSVSFGFALLLAFALGRSIPVILGAWSMGWFESLQILSRYQRALELIAGIMLIMTGLYLLNEYFFII